MADNSTQNSSGDQNTKKVQSGSGLEPNIASVLAYVFTIVTGPLFLIVEKDNKEVRFHAWQATVFGCLWFLGSFAFGVLSAIFFSSTIMMMLIHFVQFAFSVLGFILWCGFIYKAYNNERLTVPFISDLAEKMKNKWS